MSAAERSAAPRKAPGAFRTISETADALQVPQHVLRFWETKFPQIRPIKRGGGRRYYRPEDLDLLRRIAGLIYTQGYTIKGVQRLLAEGGEEIPEPAPAATPAPAPAATPAATPVQPDAAKQAIYLKAVLARTLLTMRRWREELGASG